MNKQNIIWTVVIAALVSAFVVVMLPHSSPSSLGGAAPTGATFDNGSFAGIVMAPLTGTATTSSILNNSGSDRYVYDSRLACNGLGTSQTAYTGAGLASLTLLIGTSSTASPAALTPFARVASLTVATGTSMTVMASSTTATATSTLPAIWTAGSYMSFSFNATNTAACTVGVGYLGS